MKKIRNKLQVNLTLFIKLHIFMQYNFGAERTNSKHNGKYVIVWVAFALKCYIG